MRETSFQKQIFYLISTLHQYENIVFDIFQCISPFPRYILAVGCVNPYFLNFLEKKKLINLNHKSSAYKCGKNRSLSDELLE